MLNVQWREAANEQTSEFEVGTPAILYALQTSPHIEYNIILTITSHINHIYASYIVLKNF
jgi:hypothetical protein